jgi:hypothetical protein
MKFNLPIPPQLQHLRRDDRGYPIPYFVTWIDDKPDFRLLSLSRQRECVDKGLCDVCGKKLFKESYYFITGPVGLQNRIQSHTPMHKECAEFTLIACPHIFLEKAERRQTGDIYHKASEKNPVGIMEKPDALFLIRSKSYKTFREPGYDGFLTRFIPFAVTEYRYQNGKLTIYNH